MAAAAFRVSRGRRSVAAASGPAEEVNQFCSGVNQSESGTLGHCQAAQSLIYSPVPGIMMA
jgi:hypothetical protein